jgi:mono/diheme cytochrome c family protein
MNFRKRAVLALGVAFLARDIPAALSPEQIAKLPPPATTSVDFTRDIKPIFDSACTKCHGKGKDKGDFSLETRAAFFKGGDSGNPIIAGKSAESLLIELVSGLNPDNVMPAKGSRLKAEQVSLLRAWIDQGANWPGDVTFAKAPVHNLHPRKPELPAATGLATNPVDRLLAPYFSRHSVRPGDLVTDRIFARRVYLDVIGLLPDPKELDVFVADARPDKRDRLVAKLLGDNRRYAEHWLTFWNDLLRNDYRGTGYIDGGRKQITSWLFSALLTNMPYNRFVAQLVDPTPESAGFINGITWRGAVNASQIPPMQAAQNIGQVFMGVNLKCASCHDSFINDYTLADAYGLAAIYATNELEMAECDKPTGRKAKVKFLYSELGEIDSTLPKRERTRQLAELLTSKKDGRVTRTVVNRLWAKLMGRGLVEPVDEMDMPAWNPDLLDWLAEDFADNGYDLKRTLRWILTSQAYQMPSVNMGEQVEKEFVFNGPALRRLNAEQFRDAIGELTGVWYEKPAGSVDFTGAGTPRVPRSARWIWSEANAAAKAPAEFIYLRKEFVLPEAPEEAIAAIAADNSFTLYVNGKQVGTGKDFAQPGFADLRPHLKSGENVIAVAAANHTPDNKLPAVGAAPKDAEANPAGLIFAARIRGSERKDIVSDSSWVWSRTKAPGWEKPAFDSGAWKQASELGGANMKPWSVAAKLNQAMSLAGVHGTVRASLVAADPLMVALGRPNREQVTTARQSVATTLQGLELTNGETLNKVLQQGAKKMLSGNKRPVDELVTDIFVKGLSRRPTADELTLAKELLGEPVQPEGVEDLLWSVAMLPEFQLVY